MSKLYLLAAAGVLVNGQTALAVLKSSPPIKHLPSLPDRIDSQELEIIQIPVSKPDFKPEVPEFSAEEPSQMGRSYKSSVEATDLGAKSVLQAARETGANWPFLSTSSNQKSIQSLPQPYQFKATVGNSRVMAKSVRATPEIATPSPEVAPALSERSLRARTQIAALSSKWTPDLTEFTQPLTQGPALASQLYQQRLAALKAGILYTRMPAGSFRSAWTTASTQPTHEQWKTLLTQEAKVVAKGKGQNRLSVLVGDSISLWFPSGRLPSGQLWLNQSISGETTGDILKRLGAFSQTRPDTLYVMAGINDLRRGHSNAQILGNLRQIMRQLRSTNPQAKIVVQSILPTGQDVIPNQRIRGLNEQIVAIAKEEQVNYLDLQSLFSDDHGNLRSDLTTDGLHLSHRGYQVWQWALHHPEYQTASN